MTTIHFRKSIGRSLSWRCGLVLVPLALACFALVQNTQAVNPPPDGGYPGANTAEGTDALFNLSSGIANTAVGFNALHDNTTGTHNVAVGSSALANNTTGNFNMAVGTDALRDNNSNFNLAIGFRVGFMNTTGNHLTGIGAAALRNNTTASFNTAIGADALRETTTGEDNTAIGADALTHNIVGVQNTAVGRQALENNDSSGTGFGSQNAALGSEALQDNVDGQDNTAVGFQALTSNVSAFTNVAVGTFAMQLNDSSGNGTAVFNTAVGGFALENNVDGNQNTAVGAGALEPLAGGSNNTAVGEVAGANYTGSESNNVCIGSSTRGSVGENNAIRIGDASTSHGIDVLDGGPAANFVLIGTGLGTQGISIATLIGFGSVQIANGLSTVAGASSCNIGGIYNQSFGPADMAVRIGSDNKLGTVVSSRRFKHDIKPMDKASEAILALKPVTFQYKSDTTNTPRFGLIAEDVAEISRELVIPDKEGKPLSVRYEDVNVMLLNEFLKEHKKVEEQQATIAELKNEVQTVVAQLKEQAAQIQKVSAQLEVSKPAPQIVGNQ